MAAMFRAICCHRIPAAMLFIGLLMGSLQGAQSIGICYGRTANNLPIETDVVQLYKSINVQQMRIYDSNEDALRAFRGSGIEVTVGITNDELAAMDQTAATNWVQKHIISYSDVKFKYITVGNEVFPDKNGRYDNAALVLPAMQNVYNAIRAAGLQNEIKVSTAVYPNVLDLGKPFPSTPFNDNAAQYMIPIIKFLAETGAPLLANVYPYFTKKYNPDDVDLSYALFNATEGNPGSPDYKNLFDAMVDSYYFAMEEVGVSLVPLVISETGWPSAGNDLATKDNARTYNQNLIHHVGRGTPRKRGPLETYIFALFNENLKEGEEEERNFGLFYPDKTPVYQISFN